MKFSLVLASASPRRKNLLAKLGRPFKIVPSRVPEVQKKGELPSRFVKRLAFEKAAAVAAKLKSKPCHVIGADTVVVLNGKVFGKPKSKRDAAKMLLKLSNKTHRVYTGVAVVNSRTLKKAGAVDASRVTLRSITAEEAKKIGPKHLDKAGSYAFQDKKDALVRKVKGDPQTVVGLPLRVLKKLLRMV